MRKFVVPFDNSESSKAALEHALMLARLIGNTELHIVTAHESAYAAASDYEFQPLETLRGALDRQSESILLFAREKAATAGVPHKCQVLTGSAANAIASYANEVGCEQIIMGTQGRGAVGLLLIGSVAQQVVHLAKVPVTLVKGP